MSVKVIQSERICDQNYLTSNNGCEVISCSSEDPKAPAKNILITNQKKIWMTIETIPLPQECVISLQNIRQFPQQFNVIGFYCWHQFDTNPSLIEVYFKSSQNWALVGKFRLKQIEGWQYFKVQQIDANRLMMLKIKICQNFGGKKAYLNQVALHTVNPTLIPTVRQSRASTIQQKHTNAQFMKYLNPPLPADNKDKTRDLYEKLHLTQKNLVQANHRIQILTKEQNSMKHTMIKQENIIIKLEDKLKSLVVQMQKLHNIQQNIISNNHNSTHRQRKNEGNSKEDSQTKLKKMLDVFEEQINGEEDGMKKKPHSHTHGYHTLQQKPFKQKKLYFGQSLDNQVIRINSEQNFSEYSPNRMFATHQENGQRTNSRAHSSKNKQELVQKIKLLLRLKQQKKNELSAKKSRNYPWSAYNSNFNESEGDQEADDGDDEEYFRKIKKRKIRANGLS